MSGRDGGPRPQAVRQRASRTLTADADASGRRFALLEWFTEAGLRASVEERQDGPARGQSSTAYWAYTTPLAKPRVPISRNRAYTTAGKARLPPPTINGTRNSWISSTSPAASAFPASSAPPTDRPASPLCLSHRIEPGSKSRSVRVRAGVTDVSDFANTILSAAGQSEADRLNRLRGCVRSRSFGDRSSAATNRSCPFVSRCSCTLHAHPGNSYVANAPDASRLERRRRPRDRST